MRPLPLAREVVCTNPGCTAYGLVRRLFLRTIAPGVVEIPTLVCQACGHGLDLDRTVADGTAAV